MFRQSRSQMAGPVRRASDSGPTDRWPDPEMAEGGRDGRWPVVRDGGPQGSVISPILATLYLHHVLDLWGMAKKIAKGEVMVGRYADDAVLGFQYREDGERFLKQLQER